MEYKIGELSEITHLSKEMIRYYEKLGAVRPKRRDDNNYRVYTTMDLFALLESIQLKAFDMNIHQCYSIIRNATTFKTRVFKILSLV